MKYKSLNAGKYLLTGVFKEEYRMAHSDLRAFIAELEDRNSSEKNHA